MARGFGRSENNLGRMHQGNPTPLNGGKFGPQIPSQKSKPVHLSKFFRVKQVAPFASKEEGHTKKTESVFAPGDVQELSVSDGGDSFEIVPFKGKSPESLVAYIKDYKENEINDSKPCPTVLLAALERTGVAIDYVDSKTHIVTISQVLQNGHKIHESLPPSEVLNFLKDAADFYQDKYTPSPVSVHKVEKKPTATRTAIAIEVPNQEAEQTSVVEDSSFEITPFKDRYSENLPPYIRTMDVDKMDDSAPCPPLLIEALKKTGVTVLGFNKKDNTVAISQTLENGQTIHKELSPTMVLTFLKSAVAIHKDKYFLSPHGGGKVFAKAHKAFTTKVSGQEGRQTQGAKEAVSKELDILPSDELPVQSKAPVAMSGATTPEVQDEVTVTENPKASNPSLDMGGYRTIQDKLHRLREEMAKRHPHSADIDVAPAPELAKKDTGPHTTPDLDALRELDAEIFPYVTKPMTHRSSSYVERLVVKNMQPNFWPHDLKIALQEIGAENIMPAHARLGAPLRFSLKNHAGELVQLEMSPTGVAEFLKEILLTTEDFDYTKKTPREEHPVEKAPVVPQESIDVPQKQDLPELEVESVVTQSKVSPEVRRKHFDRLLVQLKEIDSQAHIDGDKAVVSIDGKEERLSIAEAMALISDHNDAKINAGSVEVQPIGINSEPVAPLSVEKSHHSPKEQFSNGEGDIYEWFKDGFGITADQLDSVPGFKELKGWQRMWILEGVKNLRNDYVRRSIDDAYTLDLENERARAHILGSKQMGEMWLAMREKLGEKNRLEKRANEIDAGIREVRIKSPEALLRALVEEVNTPIKQTEHDDENFFTGRSRAQEEYLMKLFKESLMNEADEVPADVEFVDTLVEENEVVPVDPVQAEETHHSKSLVSPRHASTIEKGKETEELAQRFAKEFGISAEELALVKGFDGLTLPQQRMVYENLVQSTLGHVKEETLSRYSEGEAAKRAEAKNPYGKLIGNAWAGICNVLTRDFNLIKIEKEVVAKFANGGLITHKTILEQLVRGVPRTHFDEETGELMVDLVHMEFDRENRAAEYEAVRKLNDAAHQFAKIPLAWREDTLGVDGGKENEWGVTKVLKERFSDSRKNHLKYEESEKAFAEARGLLEQTLREGGKGEKEIAQILLGVDSRVNQLQFIQTSPDAVAELGNISDKNIYYETAKSLFSKSGLGYVALGYVGRTMASGLLGWFAAPVVSSGIAASKSWNKTAAELRERDRMARKGAVDMREDALNIVSADSLIEKTRRLLESYHALEQEIVAQVADGVSPMELIAKEIALLKRIAARADYIHDKQKLNKVNYGTRDQSIGKQVDLYELLGEATVIMENSIATKDSRLSDRLERYLEFKETAIDTKRRSYRRAELGKQALIAGGFAVAGALIAEYFKSVPAAREALPQSAQQPATRGLGAAPATESVTPPAAPVQEIAPKAMQSSPLVSPEVLSLKSYSIKFGDTLTKILKENLPEIKNITNPADKERALANLFESLTPDELNAIGVRSGVADSIYAGDTIKLDKLGAILKTKGGIERLLRQ
ncbi:MAG: hypothetical protein WAW13_04685 [Minisyncoccia bacterium]